jgi:hypothetical protein
LGERGLEFVEVNYSKERLFEDIKGLYAELSHKEAQETATKRHKTHKKLPYPFL